MAESHRLRIVSPPEGSSAPDDLSDWVLETAPRAMAYAVSLLRDRQTAEDVVQDCYCRLLARRHSYDLRGDGLKLLLKAVGNACINLRSRRRSFFSLFTRESRPVEVVDRSTVGPSGALLEGELRSEIDRALAALPPRERGAIELKSWGYSSAEIAEILGVKPGHAAVILHRARVALEEALSPYLRGGES